MRVAVYTYWVCRILGAVSGMSVQPEDMYHHAAAGGGGGFMVQNPVVSCEDEKRKLLCLPPEYSKFDLPFRNDFNFIDIGKLSCNGVASIEKKLSADVFQQILPQT